MTGLSWHPPLSTSSEAAATSYLEGLDRYLSIQPAAGRSFDNTHRADPDFAVGAIALAVVASSVGELDLARRALAAARAGAGRQPEFARSHIRTIDAILTQPTEPALRAARDHLGRFASDVFVIALTLHALHISGRRAKRQEALEILDAALATGVEHYVLPSLRSVIVQDLGQTDRAARDAETGLAMNGRSAHAAHGMAHVFYERADHEAGRAWLTDWMVGYDNPPSALHLSWHLALHDLALGDHERLLARYTHDIEPHSRAGLFVDAVDIMWRMRLGGANLADKWADLQRIVGPVDPVRTTSLALLQSVVALAGSNDREGLREAVRILAGYEGDRLCELAVLPMARALLAIAESDVPLAIRHLESICGDLVGVAGSNAQLDLVSNTLLWCYSRAGAAAGDQRVFLTARLEPESPARSTGAWPDVPPPGRSRRWPWRRDRSS